MSNITSGVGIFSGIDSRAIIDSLIQSASRPKTAAQQRIVTLQAQQTSFLDLNSRLNALKTAATKFNTSRLFEAAAAVSSADTVLTATAATGAAQGSYAFTVDRLVSSQQVLSRGFADSTISSAGASQFVFESAEARIDSSTRLAPLNGGSGITRGKVNIRDSSGAITLVDLSRVETVTDVLDAINTATSGRVNARTSGDSIVLEDRGAGTTVALAVTDATGYTGVAASLGIGGAATAVGNGGLINGTQINRIGTGTALSTLNDGRGVAVSSASGAATGDFTIRARDGRSFDIDIGDIYTNQPIPGGSGNVLNKTSGAVSDLAGVIARISSQTGGVITASIKADGTGLQLIDSTAGATTFQVTEISGSSRGTARDLGLVSSAAAGGNAIAGARVVAALNSTLTRGLLGGSGITDSSIVARARDGTDLVFSYNASGSVSDVISSFNAATGGKLVLSIEPSGTAFRVTDTTGGSDGLIVTGAGAASLGLDVDEAQVSTAVGVRTQRQYIGRSTATSTLNAGRGIGTGAFIITDSYGQRKTVNIDNNVRTIDDVINRINATGTGTAEGNIAIRARLNDTGDGIVVEELAGPTGPGIRAISIADSGGGVARALNIAGTATGTGSANKLNGSFEKKITFTAADTLQQVADKINTANVAAVATVVNDGTPGTPFRLNLTARNSGEAGRFILDSGGLDIGLTTLSEGNNSRVFFGASDPARAILVSGNTNTISGVVQGVTIEAKSVSATPVTVTVTASNETLETGLDDLVKAYNDIISRLTSLTNYDATLNRRGTLLGDSLAASIESDLASTINSTPLGVSGRYQFLSQVGFKFDKDGLLSVDKDKFRTALSTDRQSVKDLLSAKAALTPATSEAIPGVPGATVRIPNTIATFSALGIGEKLGQLVERYTKATEGILPRRNKTLDTQIQSQNGRIKAIDSRLASQRSRLERQFLAAETVIGRLRGQQGSIAGIAGLSG